MDTMPPFSHVHKLHGQPLFSSLPPSSIPIDSLQHGCRHKSDYQHGCFSGFLKSTCTSPFADSADGDMVSKQLERPEREGGGKMADVPPGRCRSPLVPLRNRQLPASFWQEPNVPRDFPYPFFQYPLNVHPMAAVWNEYSPAAAVSLGASLPQAKCTRTSGKTALPPVQSSREFLERLQSAQVRGYDLAASRFPITEFLFFNYGIKSYLDSAAGNTESVHRGIPLSVSAASVTSGKVDSVNGVNAFGGVNSVLPVPTVCPYLGYNCPNLHNNQTPHRFWDCVMGQKSMSQQALASMHGSQTLKSVSGRTASAYPARFHPFANG